MAITWTKEWMASDDGTILSGLDLKNIQDDITSGSTGDATSIWGIPVVQPTAAEDGKVVIYNHATPAFEYAVSSSVVIPTGVILLWSGAISAIPTGWTICDGTAGTPNLTDRFVIHADADAAGTNNVGDTGGVSTHTLTTGEMPAHTHEVPGKNNGVITTAANFPRADTLELDGNVNTLSAGGGGAHTNRDKFYALAYIMKT